MALWATPDGNKLGEFHTTVICWTPGSGFWPWEDGKENISYFLEYNKIYLILLNKTYLIFLVQCSLGRLQLLDQSYLFTCMLLFFLELLSFILIISNGIQSSASAMLLQPPKEDLSSCHHLEGCSYPRKCVTKTVISSNKPHMFREIRLPKKACSRFT